MKIALQIWLIAVLAECILYSIFVKPTLGLFIIPFALLGALPGVLLFWFLLEAIHSLWDDGAKKWWSIVLAAFVCANGTLFLFLLITDFKVNAMPVWTILNVAIAIAVPASVPAIKKKYFTIEEPQLWDAETDARPYQFKNIRPEENNEKV